MTGPNGDPEATALDNAEAAIEEGKEQVAEEREAAMAAADSAAQRDAIAQRFDGIEAALSNLSAQVSEAVSQSTQATVAPLSERLAGFDTKLDTILAGGGAGATQSGDSDDGIVSIEEIPGAVGDAVEGAGDAVAGAAGDAAEAVDKAPARAHVLFRRFGRGG